MSIIQITLSALWLEVVRKGAASVVFGIVKDLGRPL